MSRFAAKWPRIALSAATISLLILIAEANAGAAPPSQTPPPPPLPTPTPTPTPTAQPTNPILLTDPVPDPKQEGVLWFAPTGHTLRGKFLDYWNKNGGLAQFGYPSPRSSSSL